jgi:hypothetical protein
MSKLDELTKAINRLNANFERVYPPADIPTMTRRQVCDILGVSNGTISNYEAKYGSAFKICRNEYSAEFVRALKNGGNA